MGGFLLVLNGNVLIQLAERISTLVSLLFVAGVITWILLNTAITRVLPCKGKLAACDAVSTHIE